MAMTVLPSFQTFLQNSATPQPPSPLLNGEQRPQSPSYSPYGWHQASGMQLPYNTTNTTSYYSYRQSYSPVSTTSGSETEDEDMASSRRSGFKRPLTSVGLSAAPLSPSTACGTAGKRVKKKYLKERERCEIVRRVRAGEKQAHLAKEFGVSRAAVCYLLKHQIEIMRRSSQRL
ncbi:Uracil phosphoribosyltransferase [Phytophthora cinnamomi]|uniref:Uracil phosphoribosyltransferase n=1 Tax=Phytophthora cinnamomi TaxID=4785 RepID=UPI00355A3DE9|nr:Uracil phosphoribosyltransferase [Phytophthora cinnamomi]